MIDIAIMNYEKKISDTTAILIIVFLGVLFQKNYINDFPSHIHAWAQSDRYALSLGFLDNGLSFFKPQTFVYNHQFPDNWTVPSENAITAVDFPIHDYIPALLMKISGNTSPWIFRLYILLYSFFGLFFLFKLSYAVTKDYVKAVLILVFAATSPIYVYYQGGFLPTIPSLSNAIIGIYFYYRFLKEAKNKDFWLSILLLTLAALSRTTFAIPIFAVLAIEFIRILKKETDLVSKLIPVGISIFSLLSYLLYNGYLREKYGSIFLNHLMLPDSIGQAKEIIIYVFDHWIFQYFTRPHYLIFISVILVSVYFIAIRKSRIQKTIVYFGLLTITYLFGCVLFAFLMLKQFHAHDYYFLDTFFLPIVMSLISILSLIPLAEKRILKIVTITSICFISILFILQPIKSQEKRRETGFWDRTEATINNYRNSSTYLDSLGIPKSSKILVIDAIAPNIPFILMHRKGYAIMNTSQENIEEALIWNYDYIVLQNEFFLSHVYSVYPEIITKITKIADNGNLSICTHSDSILDQTLTGFLGFDDQSPVFESIITYDTIRDNLWKNTQSTSELSYSGNSCGILSRDMVYGLTFKTHQLEALTKSKRTLLLSSFFRSDGANDCGIVVSISENGKNTYYKTFNLQKLLTKQGEWEKVNLIFQLPKITSEDYEFGLYIVNSGKIELYIDDFGFKLY